jgi:hypothetical protein
MQDAIDRVMNTYTMIANLNPEKERDLRQAVTAHLSKFPETDANVLAVEGLRFARETAA